MSLHLDVDLASGVPPYEQVRLQVLAHVAAGRLRDGDRLPTIRALATDLGVAAGTVARAYRELEAAGVVRTRRRTGTVVAAGRGTVDDAVARAAADLVALARAAGLGDAAVVDVVRGALLTPGDPGGREPVTPAAPAPGGAVRASGPPGPARARA